MTSVTMSINKINHVFWNDRMEIVRNNTLPSMYNLLVKTGRWDLMKLKVKKGAIPHWFWDSDLAKFLEAVCYSLKYMSEDDSLKSTFTAWIDELSEMIVLAQEPSGYLNSYFSTMDPDNKLKNITEKHELYCLGHLLEAGIAHYVATGKTHLLNALCRYLDLICDLFGPEDGKIHGYPGHQELEIAIAKLLELKWVDRYWKLLEYFVEQRGYNDGEFFDEQARLRGVDPDTYIPIDADGDPAWERPRFYEYYQAETQIRDTVEVKGHAVRQFYFLTGVQKVAQFKNDDTLREAVKRLWNNTVERKMYIHGGIGAIDEYEGFGKEYDLRWDGYSETCASIALVFCGQAILKDRLDSDVARVVEKALFNNVLGGVSLDGRSYYYDQPITGTKGLKRRDWFVCSCCPPNVARLFNSLEEYVVYKVGEVIAVNLYIGGEFTLGGVQLKVSTNYPLSGGVTVQVDSVGKAVPLAIRAPQTAYKVSTDSYEEKDGYLFFTKRTWDTKIKIEFDLAVDIVEPDPKVDANRGCLAVEYGPFVYALEKSGVEAPGNVCLDALRMSKDQRFERELVIVNGCKFWQLCTTLGGTTCKLVPYFTTGNIFPGEDFRVWIREC